MAKNVALAVVINPGGTIVLDGSSGGAGSGEGVSDNIVRDCIERDLTRYPELRAKAAAIDEIVIVSDEDVSSSDYAQDMMQCYVRRMEAGGWARPEGLHIFETFLGPVTVYIAYGI